MLNSIKDFHKVAFPLVCRSYLCKKRLPLAEPACPLHDGAHAAQRMAYLVIVAIARFAAVRRYQSEPD